MLPACDCADVAFDFMLQMMNTKYAPDIKLAFWSFICITKIGMLTCVFQSNMLWQQKISEGKLAD